MNVIKVPTIRSYQENYPAAAGYLGSWLKVVKVAKWSSLHDAQQVYPRVSVLKSGRLVFNIYGNTHRLIVRVNYSTQSIYVRWFGTHQEYDRTDADSV